MAAETVRRAHRTVLDESRPMSEALLFRYSACTFNAHRIHYDLPYAREVEKYPGLSCMARCRRLSGLDAAHRQRGRAPDRFAFRGVLPMFHRRRRCGSVASARTEGSLGSLHGNGQRPSGHDATASWEETA